MSQLCFQPFWIEAFHVAPSFTNLKTYTFFFLLLLCQVSETLVVRNGDFLVRDSLTSVGDYVLTCRWDNEVLHFKISKVLVKSNETKVCIQPLLTDCLSKLSSPLHHEF